MTSLTWIITGSSRGFGRAIAEHALGRGDNVVAAVRRPEAVSDLVARHQPTFATAYFDAATGDQVDEVVATALDRFGRIDVLVNNAGRGIVGAAEEISDAELRASLNLHVLVPAALVRAVLATMRARRSGTIVQMWSQGGRLSFPGVGAYSAGKFALEGWSEALAGEVAPFGIRVMLVEPSRFRTAFNEPDVLSVAVPSPTYRSSLDAVRADLFSPDGRQEGDPANGAAIIAGIVHGTDVPLRLPLDAEAVERLGNSYRSSLDGLARWADVARAADFAGVAPSSRPV